MKTWYNLAGIFNVLFFKQFKYCKYKFDAAWFNKTLKTSCIKIQVSQRVLDVWDIRCIKRFRQVSDLS